MSDKGKDITEVIPKEGQFTTYALSENNKLHGFFENKDSFDNNFVILIIESSYNVIDFAKMTFEIKEKE